MTWLEHGRIHDGAIILSSPLPLPEGTEVAVRVETISPGLPAGVSPEPGESRSSAFFGMWADREDLIDSGAWVRKERERWQERVGRQG